MPQRLEVGKHGINGWYCTQHNIYNDILTLRCCYCDELRDESLAIIATKVRIRREGITMSETERELHAEFFTRWCDDERLLIKDMSDEALTAHRNELARIALESKVRTTTADEEIRQRRAKKGQENKPWLVPSESDYDPSAVKIRKERMSKMDKTAALLKELIGVEGAEEIVSNLTKKESGGSINSAPSRVLTDKAMTQPTLVKSNNTQGSLLSDVADSLIAGIETRPIEDLVSAAKTAGHIANKILGPEVKTKPNDDEIFDFSKLETKD